MKRLSVDRPELIAMLLAVVVAGLWMHPYRAQQASRYALTAAIVEQGTVVLDDYEHVVGIDRAVRDGRLYSDKAPGQPVLAVPFYAVYRAVGGEPGHVLRVEANAGLWWLTLWFSAIPLGLLTVVIRRHLRSRGWGRVAWPVSLAIGYGTLLLPFGGLLFGHVFAALLLATTFLLVDRPGASGMRLVTAGVAAGLAVATEYPAILGVVPLAIYAGWRHRWRAGLFLAGGVPIAGLLALYNVVAFGGPFNLSYRFTAFSEVTETARPVLDMFGGLNLDNLAAQFVHPRGLFLATPVVLLGCIGLGFLWRRSRSAALLGTAIVIAHLSVVAFWGNPWGGDSPGARYFVPAIPFLALPLATVWERASKAASLLAGVGAVVMFAAVATDPLLPRDTDDGAHTWLTWLLRGETAPTVLGHSAVIVWLLGAAGLVLAIGLFDAERRSVAVEPTDAGVVPTGRHQGGIDRP